MATHSSLFAWRIPWTEEPGGLQSMELQRLEPDFETKQQYSTLILPGLDLNLQIWLPIGPVLLLLYLQTLFDDSAFPIG